MTAISQTMFQDAFLWMKNIFFIKISLKLVLHGPVVNKWVLVQVMAWRWTGDELLPEPMLAQYNDAYMRH